MTQDDIDKKYIRRCLQIARNGRMTARPNPSVGAVIVSADDCIIGEGFTSAYGGPHAEVNAFASVSKEHESLLSDSTVYVSLEPCSHYGHTPPCCDLIISKKVKRVVCGCVDPFAQVCGRGIQKIREAGIEVTVGVLEDECIDSNKVFFTYNTAHRPYIILKWAQSANGFMDHHFHPVQLSTKLTKMFSHKLRAENDAILVGRVTQERDSPQLTTRHWSGPDPKKVVLADTSIGEVLDLLNKESKQSLIVEGGATTLESFIDKGLWDEIRVETALDQYFTDGTRAPQLPSQVELACIQRFGNNIISLYKKINHGKVVR